MFRKKTKYAFYLQQFLLEDLRYLVEWKVIEVVS